MAQLLISLICAAILLQFAVVACSAVMVTKQSTAWVLENSKLKVTVNLNPGRVSVLDKLSGYHWNQPSVASAPVFANARKMPNGMGAGIGKGPGHEPASGRVHPTSDQSVLEDS